MLPASHDGSHDFDWIFGTWKATLRRLVKPLTGSTTWVDFEGRQISKTIWGGKANLDEFIVDSPKAGVQIEGVALRLYDPASQQWQIYWANSKRGIVDPPVVGRFSNGRGEFYGMDELDGRSDPRPLRLVEHHAQLGALRAIVLGGWRKDVGGELDLGRDAHDGVSA